MKYQPIYFHCSFCGRMLFEEDNFLKISDDEEENNFCDNFCLKNYKNNTPLDDIEPLELSKDKTDASSIENIDPITLSVMNGAVTSICKEMGKTMMRTAFSPIFFEGNDFTCALFDDKIELIAQFEGNPAQLGAMKFAVKNAIRRIGFENLYEEDVIIHNDPYIGSPHLPEFCMIRPVFYDGQIVGYTSIIAHFPDVGGKDPGSFPGDATEIFQEGIFIPPVKLFEKGKENDPIWKIILSNVRIPHETYGDFMAMYGSLITAENSVIELIEKYGSSKYLMYVYEVKNYAERIMRDEIKKIPKGIYQSIRMVDDDGTSSKSYAIRLKMKVLDTDIIFDFRDTDEQANGPINTPYGVGVSGPKNAIFNLVTSLLPHNEGAFRPLHFIIPPKKLLNAVYPAPISGGNTETYNLVASSVIAALSEAIPEKVAASAGDTNALLTGGGIDNKSNKHFGFVIWEPVGWGGRFSSDGDNAIITFCGLTANNYSTEVIETVYPLRIHQYKLRNGSGGAGKFRGGLGVIREYEILCENIRIGAHSNRNKFPAEGLFGGSKGGKTIFLFSKDSKMLSPQEFSSKALSPTKFSGLQLNKGQRIIVMSPGGGGYGEPKYRDKTKVIDDIKNEYIEINEAIELYGIPQEEAEFIKTKYCYKEIDNGEK